MIPELQAVILAGGEGSKMFPLTEGLPKCLLPIANMPMIWYVVKYLEKSGFTDIIVIVQSNVASQVTQVLDSFHNNINFDVVSLPEQDDLGTADALSLVKDRIKSDVLVVSSDMMTDVPLHRLVDIHRTYDASFTALFTKRVQLPVEQSKTDKKKQMDPNHGTRDFVALDKDEGRLLFLSNEADLEQENISFKKSTLKRYPHINIDTELTDCHLYVMKKWLIDYLSKNNQMENLKSDFVPHILRKQFSKKKKVVPSDDMSYLHEDEILSNSSSKAGLDIFSYSMPDELTCYLQDWSSYAGRCLKDQIKCHGFISDDQFCLRVNTLPAYVHMNREIGKFKDTIAQSLEIQKIHPTVSLSQKSQIGNDCMIGKSSNIGNNVTIKKSVVGENCNIGSNVRISNCIIMNNVKISDGCNLQGSIICENADIQQNCSLTNCQVSSGYNLRENSEIKNEAIVQEEMEFEE